MSKKIAVIGLGAMGSRMAARLLAAGHDVVVYNRTPDRARPLIDQGATLAASPREAAAGRAIVIAMVRDDEASRAVWLDAETGALASIGEDAVAIESSTLTPAWTATLAEAMTARGVSFLDAPVAGSRPQADAGQLVYLVGGEHEPLDAVRDLLLAIGGAVHHIGPTGAGMVMKLAVNALFGIQVAAFGEALAMTRRAGIADAQAVEVLAAMPVTSPALEGVSALMARRKFDPLFPIELVEKDLGYVVAAASRLGTTAPVAAAVRAVYAEAIAGGLGGENIAAVVKVYESRSPRRPDSRPASLKATLAAPFHGSLQSDCVED